MIILWLELQHRSILCSSYFIRFHQINPIPLKWQRPTFMQCNYMRTHIDTDVCRKQGRHSSPEKDLKMISAQISLQAPRQTRQPRKIMDLALKVRPPSPNVMRLNKHKASLKDAGEEGQCAEQQPEPHPSFVQHSPLPHAVSLWDACCCLGTAQSCNDVLHLQKSVWAAGSAGWCTAAGVTSPSHFTPACRHPQTAELGYKNLPVLVVVFLSRRWEE